MQLSPPNQPTLTLTLTATLTLTLPLTLNLTLTLTLTLTLPFQIVPGDDDAPAIAKPTNVSLHSLIMSIVCADPGYKVSRHRLLLHIMIYTDPAYKLSLHSLVMRYCYYMYRPWLQCTFPLGVCYVLLLYVLGPLTN